MEYSIKPNGNHYELYVDGKHISNGGSYDECYADYKDYKKEMGLKED